MTISSEIDERTLRELYLVPFEAAVHRADVRVVMSGYNRLNGTFCSEHHWLLTELLRDEWGFDGVVVSDWFGTHSAAESLLAGLDVEMPGPPRARGEHLRAALERGDVHRRRSRPLGRPCARPRRLDGRRRHRHDGGHRRRPGDTVGHPAGDGTRGGAAEERRRRAAAGSSDAARGADRPVRPLRPPAGRWQRRGCIRTTGGDRWRRCRRAGSTSRSSRVARSPSTCRPSTATSPSVSATPPAPPPRWRRIAWCGSGTRRRPRGSTRRRSRRGSAARSSPTSPDRGSSACAPSGRPRCRSTA